MKSHAHVARKRFGQNFLVDRAVIEAIVRAIDPQPDDAMVEIGPGLAALTAPLIEARAAVAAGTPVRRPLQVVELDRDLAAKLRHRFDAEQLVVHEADALAFDFASLVDERGPALRIAGNLPYNISTPLLFHLLAMADRVVDQHFMLQKEVVARMVALPGTSDFGRLSVMLQVRYDLESLFDVPPTAFDPPPKVTSAIVRMIPLPVATLAIRDRTRFARIVTTAFGQRRKMLRNTLVEHAEAMEALGIAPTARAEEIGPQTWVALSNWE